MKNRHGITRKKRVETRTQDVQAKKRDKSENSNSKTPKGRTQAQKR